MNDIWSIIGLSSLVASVVTVILGIVRDVLVEKHRFKRESEAGYVQSQIRMYSQIHFLLQRILSGLVSFTEYFELAEHDIKEINNLLRRESSLLKPIVINEWLGAMRLMREGIHEKDPEKQEEIARKNIKHFRQLDSTIKDIMNNNLIPKYRKIVGETVPNLE